MEIILSLHRVRGGGITFGLKEITASFSYPYDGITASKATMPSKGVRVANGASVTFADCQVYLQNLQIGKSETDADGNITFDNAKLYSSIFFIESESDTETVISADRWFTSEFAGNGTLSFINNSVLSAYLPVIEWTENVPDPYCSDVWKEFYQFNYNLTFSNSTVKDIIDVNSLKTLSISNLTFDYSTIDNYSLVSVTPTISATENLILDGDVSYIEGEWPVTDVNVLLGNETYFEVKNLTKTLIVEKVTQYVEDDILIAKGDQTSISNLDITTTYSETLYNETPVEQVVTFENITDGTYEARLLINYFKFNHGYPNSSVYYIEKNKTLLENLDGIINSTKEDYVCYKTEYFIDIYGEPVENIDISTFVVKNQNSTYIRHWIARDYEIKYENLKGAYLNEEYADKFSIVNIDDIGEYKTLPSKNVLENLPSENEFIFDGWSLTEGGAKISWETGVEITNSNYRGFTLYARWISVYTVVIDSNNGEETSTYYIQEGNTVAQPTDPTLAKHRFLNWYDSEDSTKAEFDFTKDITKNTTIIANFLRIWEITFDASDATSFSSGANYFDEETKTYTAYLDDGEVLEEPYGSPEQDLYRVDYWYDIEDETQSQFDFNNVKKDATLKIKWKIKTFNIYFQHSEMDEFITESWPAKIENVEIGSSIEAPVLDEAPEGYYFLYWKDNNGEFDFSYINSYSYAIYLEALWKPIQYKVEYVTTMPNGEEPTVVNNTYVTITMIDSHLGLPTIDDLEFADGSKYKYYTLKGWAINPDDVEGTHTSYPVSVNNYQNMPTFYAIWVAQKFTIEFNHTTGFDENATNWPANVTVDALTNFAEPTTYPNLNGYYFDGWYIEDYRVEFPITSVEQNYAFTAKWTKATYSITYILTLPDNTTPSGLELQGEGYDKTYTVDSTTLTLPQESNFVSIPQTYVFKGWSLQRDAVYGVYSYDIPDDFVYAPLTFYAIWQEKSFTVNINLKPSDSEYYVLNKNSFDNTCYFQSVLNSNTNGHIYNEETSSYTIYVKDETQSIVLPNTADLFVNDPTKIVSNYIFAGSNLTSDLTITYEEVLANIDENGNVDISFEIADCGVSTTFMISPTAKYDNLAVSMYWTESSYPAVILKYDSTNGYTIVEKLNDTQKIFDTKYFNAGSYNFEVVVLLENDFDLDTINSYSDLAGLSRLKYQYQTTVIKGSIYYSNDIISANMNDEFEYDGQPHKPTWATVPSKYEDTRIVATEETNAGYYTAIIELVNTQNYELKYLTEEVAEYFTFSWNIKKYSIMWNPSANIQTYTGQEQSLSIDEMIYNYSYLPGGAWDNSEYSVVCAEGRVENNVLYFTNAGSYVIYLTVPSNFNFSENVITLVVDPISIADPTTFISVEWNNSDTLISVNDFFATDVTGIVAFAEGSETNPTAIGSYNVYFELTDATNYAWGSSGGISGGGEVIFPMGDGVVVDNPKGTSEVKSAMWELTKKKIEIPTVNFYSDKTTYSTLSFTGTYYHEYFAYFMEDIFDTDFEPYLDVFGTDSDYYTYQNPSQGYTQEPGDIRVRINLTNPEFTCWDNNNYAETTTYLEVHWVITEAVAVEEVYIDAWVEYYFNSNNQVVYTVKFANQQYANLSYSVRFVNYTLFESMGGGSDGFGVPDSYVDEFPPLLEGSNEIRYSIYFDEPYHYWEYGERTLTVVYDPNSTPSNPSQGGENDGGNNGENNNNGGEDGGNMGIIIAAAGGGVVALGGGATTAIVIKKKKLKLKNPKNK